MIKKIFFLTVVIMLLTGIMNASFANQISFDGVTQEANNWITMGENAFSTSGIDVGEITNIVSPIAQALTVIGVGILLVVAAVMGIKWITANPEEQAKLKQQSIGLVVAAAVILGAYTIWKIALNIASAL